MISFSLRQGSGTASRNVVKPLCAIFFVEACVFLTSSVVGLGDQLLQVQLPLDPGQL
jgi:hypothetical protein